MVVDMELQNYVKEVERLLKVFIQSAISLMITIIEHLIRIVVVGVVVGVVVVVGGGGGVVGRRR